MLHKLSLKPAHTPPREASTPRMLAWTRRAYTPPQQLWESTVWELSPNTTLKVSALASPNLLRGAPQLQAALAPGPGMRALNPQVQGQQQTGSQQQRPLP